MEKQRINDEDLKQANGAGYHLKSRKAIVYAISGAQFGFYHSLSSTQLPFMMINSGTEMEVNPELQEGYEYGNGYRMLAGYAAMYADHYCFIRASEVLIEWK